MTGKRYTGGLNNGHFINDIQGVLIVGSCDL